jgi:phage baseplate assembly protein W
MTVQRISRSFKDISLSFEPHPVTKDLPILKNENAIRRAVRNLVETGKTERFFNPDLGTSIYDSLFEFVDVATASAIQFEIESTLLKYEERVENLRIFVVPKPNSNEFNVSVAFDIIGQDVPTQEFSFLLEATR